MVGLAFYLYRRDLAAREAAADQLRRANDELEIRVKGRTEALSRTVDELNAEVTERKRAEEALAATAGELRRSNRELQEFAQVASHDLQEPLRKIQAFGDRLAAKGEGIDETARDYLARMLDAAGRMRRLIDDLLTFARVSTRTTPPEAVDLTAVAQEVVADLQGRLEQAGGRIDVAPLPTVEAEPTQMRQLLQNLLGNALKFRRADLAPLVTVSGRLLPGGERCEVAVKDNGIGFEEKYLDRIFNVFQRLHGRGEYEGTGMGLAICRKIVDQHGGTITARSRPGEGSTFLVTLPLHRPRAQEVA
jgi:light-regulated signal transduction histidine kinase (bacteriophytochrome)